LLNEEQDEGISRKLVTALSSKLERGERVQAVSVQQKLVINIVTEAIVATTERLLIVRDLVFGKILRRSLTTTSRLSPSKRNCSCHVSITTATGGHGRSARCRRKARRK